MKRFDIRLQPHHYRLWIGLCLTLILLGSAVGIALPAGLGWDFANFYDTGRRVAAGEYENLYDEYSQIAGQEPQGHMRFYGVPLSGFFFVPLAWFGPELASCLFKLQGFIALVVSLGILYWHARQFVTPTDEKRWSFAASFATLAVAYQPFWTIYRVGGQTTPTIVLLLMAALLSYVRQRINATAFLLVLVILIKPAFVLGIGLLAIASGLPLCLRLATGGAVAAGLSLLLAGYSTHVEFIKLMLSSTKTSVSWLYNSASTVAIENLRLLDDPKPMRPVRPAHLTRWVDGTRLMIGITFLMVAWRVQRTTIPCRASTRRLFVFLLSLTFGLALMPIAWEHYLSVLFLPLCYVFAVRDRLPRAARVLVCAALVLAAIQNFVLIEWLHAHWNVDSWAEAIFAGLLKGAPSLLAIALFTAYHREIIQRLDEQSSEAAEGSV